VISPAKSTEIRGKLLDEKRFQKERGEGSSAGIKRRESGRYGWGGGKREKYDGLLILIKTIGG